MANHGVFIGTHCAFWDVEHLILRKVVHKLTKQFLNLIL